MPIVGDIELLALNVPKTTTIGLPYAVKLKVMNHSRTTMDLQLQLRKDDMKGVFCSSTAHLSLGMMDPSTSKVVVVEVLPLLVGLQELHGIVVVDRLTQREYPMHKVVELLVIPALTVKRDE